MAISGVITSQTGGRRFRGTDFTKYSHFVGGLNSTYHSLLNYSPQVTGFPRLFMVRQPEVLSRYFGGNNAEGRYSSNSEFMMFKHALEYMLASFNGLGDLTLDVTGTKLEGGAAGRGINIPTVTKDATDTFTTRLYEVEGSLIFSVVDTWMNMIGDMNSGYATYGGLISGGFDSSTGKEKRLFKPSTVSDTDGIAYNEANHTCEFIYMLTDRSGAQVERAWMLADCFPKSISQSVASDYTPGTHDLVAYDIQWNCVVYRSPIITTIANDLLKQYLVVSNYLNFNPQLGDAVWNDDNTFTRALGDQVKDAASGTDIGNLPVYDGSNSPDTRNADVRSMDVAKHVGERA